MLLKAVNANVVNDRIKKPLLRANACLELHSSQRWKRDLEPRLPKSAIKIGDTYYLAACSDYQPIVDYDRTVFIARVTPIQAMFYTYACFGDTYFLFVRSGCGRCSAQSVSEVREKQAKNKLVVFKEIATNAFAVTWNYVRPFFATPLFFFRNWHAKIENQMHDQRAFVSCELIRTHL